MSESRWVLEWKNDIESGPLSLRVQGKWWKGMAVGSEKNECDEL